MRPIAKGARARRAADSARRVAERPEQTVAQPPPEVADRVTGGGPWGPSAFDLPDPRGNKTAILAVSIAAAVVLLALIGALTIFYFSMN